MSYSWQISKSKWLIWLLLVVYFLSLLACFMNALSWWIKIILVIGIFLNAWQTFKNTTHESWQLDFDNENGWQILEDSTTRTIKILPSTVISTMFIFLHYQTENKKFYRLIFKDALLPNINDYRQLIVTLKTYQ
ncbi:MAG: protein YgfX [Methylococcaceae bacterium]